MRTPKNLKKLAQLPSIIETFCKDAQKAPVFMSKNPDETQISIFRLGDCSFEIKIERNTFSIKDYLKSKSYKFDSWTKKWIKTIVLENADIDFPLFLADLKNICEKCKETKVFFIGYDITKKL